MDNETGRIKVEFSYLPLINFAMQQNKVSVIHQLSIENLTSILLNDIRIQITAEPDFGSIAPVAVEAIPANESISIQSFSLVLSANYFAQLTERLSGSLKVEVLSEEEVLFSQSYPIDILAYDQWGGISVFPEMLSAFVTPNNSVLQPIIKRAAAILEQWTGNPSLDEYQSRNPDRVRKQMAAIYTAISEQQIIYSTIPASFEEQGQRIRLVDSVISQKLATCLDMTLLYASCLESIGINPLIVIHQGHAFAGGWLVPETFPDPTIDDVSLLTKRTAEGIYDITLIETTCMNMAHQVDFDDAVKAANAKLIDPGSFLLAVDVKRARYSGIRPIPQRILNGMTWEIKEEPELDQNITHAAPQSVNPYDLSGTDGQTVMTKQLLWERRLLDLSLRNNLLNIRITKNTLQLLPANLALLEDALADGEEFRILHNPSDWENPSMEFGIYSSIPETDPIIDFVNSELTQKRLRFYLTENDLGKALTHLYRSSRTSIEESGANTLYLALGLLKWYETPSSERPRYAPILLLPVEIIRKSAAKGYVIRSREEETMMNITLLEMLRQNFGISVSGLDPLPADGSGVNVKLIYSIIRNSIKNQRKWDVEEQAILGIFSFNKFIMWNDIHYNADKLSKNKIVSSLINGKIEWNAATKEMDAAYMDKQMSPADIVLPIIADSSQLEAIYEAVNDKTFILHGPPGTGKSQTITNIIANALYRGKRVLFVAEKMAALSVVQNRLAAIGLAPFCLEIHSNKTKKSAVISQLKETAAIIRQSAPEEFGKEAEHLLNLRTELNKYVEALHKEYSFGFSLYDAIIRYQSINAEPYFTIPVGTLRMLNKELFSQWDEAVESMARTTSACGHPYRHPLTGISITEYSAAFKEEAHETFTTFIGLLNDIEAKLPNFFALLDDTDMRPNRKDFQTIAILIEILIDIPELTPQLVTMPSLYKKLEELREVTAHGKNRDEMKAKVETGFTKDILKINAGQLLAEWNQASAQWFFPRYFGQRKVKKTIKVYALKSVASATVQELLRTIINYQEEAEFVSQYTAQLPSLFGKSGRDEDWETIERIMNAMSLFNSRLMNYSNGATAKAKQIKQNLALHLEEGIQSFRETHAEFLNELHQLSDQLITIEDKLSETLGIQTKGLYTESVEWINIARQKAEIWKNNLNKLKDWYHWLQAYKQLKTLRISYIAEIYKEKNIPTEQLLDSFHKSFYRAAIQYIISKEPTLELFNGKIFNTIIDKYKEVSANFEELTKQELFAKLASNIPSFTHEAIQSSEVGILQKNLRNNARGISIRKLFDQIPTLLPRMCPCMLMSPLSVAQYIDTDSDKFDLIVFDEASQMPTYEAVGAIARGKNVVIVGDPKQMPPTSFFSVNTVDEDNIEMEDLESILDDCLALSIPSKYLLWHYRSKHESLITFSNSEYYNNKLMTFPSPDNIESKVRMVSIKGFYDKGKSRQNLAEAQAVVNEIARRLKSEELRKMSIGVVTFSVVQQALIEDLLSDLFISHPRMETLALGCKEPLFIKNLENVQGDERDVILFSVGYGPDAEGKVSMNFGPLNRAGGERRLNVAVSRARYEMIIFSTLRADMINLNRTSSVGVAGLKRFLEYAEKGTRQTINGVAQLSDKTDSIENIIAEKLRSLGYTVHTDIGCSGYKIDIGIVDPENPSSYRLGIICDGKNYKRTKTARDREIVQNNVLKALGWNIYRIWTMDWWEKSDEVIESIKQAIAGKVYTDNKKANAVLSDPKEVTQVETVLKEACTVSGRQAALDLVAAIKKNRESKREMEYTETPLQPSRYYIEKFLIPKGLLIIRSQIDKIIENEAPISKTLLRQKIMIEWGVSRLGAQADIHLESILKEHDLYQTEHDGIIFLWKDEGQCRYYTGYRPKSGRAAVDLPPEEIANGVKHILMDSISLPLPDLSKACAKLFGFPRMGSIIDAAIQRGIREAVKRKFAKMENDRVTIID